MKRRISLLAAALLAAFSLTGCVKVIDKGTEGQYTGQVAFDAAADSSGDWGAISEEIIGKAAELGSLLSGEGIATPASAVSGTATVKEFVSKANGKKNSLVLELEGYDGKENITMQIGSIYSDTVIRDLQTLKNFESFTNQTEWSQYAKALNAEMHTQVVEPLGIDENVVGKKVTFAGGANRTGDDVVITPVSLTIE